MSILTENLPTNVEVGGLKVPINCDFQASIFFTTAIQDESLNEVDRILNALKCYFKESDLDSNCIKEFIDSAFWFYCCGKSDLVESENNKIPGKGKIVLSFEHDADMIYAAFYDQYGIDLQTEHKMHWWKFRALFDNLRDDVPIKRVMHFRAIDTVGMTKAEKQFYNERKKAYKLPIKRNVEETKLIKDINDALANGKDISRLLDRR